MQRRSWQLKTQFIQLWKENIKNLRHVAITPKSTNDMFANLHWEVWVLLVILENISDSLVNHGEEWLQCSHTCEIHDVLLLESKLQTLDNQTVGWEVFLNDVNKVTLDLKSHYYYWVQFFKCITQRGQLGLRCKLHYRHIFLGEWKLFAYVRNALGATFDFREVVQRRRRRLWKRHFLNGELALIQP